KSACKTGTDQVVELSILKKVCHPLPADLFSDAGIENLNRAVIDLAVDQPDAVAIASGLFVETTQESRAFRRQSERDRNHRINWLCNDFPRSMLLCRRLDNLHNEALLFRCRRGR